MLLKCDTDLAGDVETRRSTTGVCSVLFGAVIHWVAKLQPTVAFEYEQNESSAVFEDNATAIAFSEQVKRTNALSK